MEASHQLDDLTLMTQSVRRAARLLGAISDTAALAEKAWETDDVSAVCLLFPSTASYERCPEHPPETVLQNQESVNPA